MAKEHKVNKQTIDDWRKRFSELSSQDIKRVRALEGENARLKKLLAERKLAINERNPCCRLRHGSGSLTPHKTTGETP